MAQATSTKFPVKAPKMSVSNGTKNHAPKAATPKAAAAEKPVPKYVAQQANRKRFSFGDVWTAAVMAGTVKDKAKLVAHGVKVEVGTAKELSAMDMPTLLAKVQEALKLAAKKAAK